MVIKYAEKARWIGSRSSSTSGSRRTANATSATDGPFGFANTKEKALRDRDEVCQCSAAKMVSCRSAPFEPCLHTRQGRLTQRCVRSASRTGYAWCTRPSARPRSSCV